MKIAVVTCYKYNDYERARALRTAIATCNGVETIVIRNHWCGLLRYPEVFLKICWVRLAKRPDTYVITFRGYETLLFMRLTLVRKPIIFDELVNFTEWMEEHGRLGLESLLYRLFRRWNHWLVKRCRFILADTTAHAEKSATLNKLSVQRYRVIPVCADENLFRFVATPKKTDKLFTVLYYGSMLPLHGVEHVLEAAKLLQAQTGIRFRLVGVKRGSRIAKLCDEAAKAGSRIRCEGWMELGNLPQAIHDADLVLGGPFGNTTQSQYVVTGKTSQALASGAPVLIGKNRVNEDFINKQNCLMVPQADPQALADAISWAHEHPKELADIGRAGRKLYNKHFSQQVVNGLVAKMIGEL